MTSSEMEHHGGRTVLEWNVAAMLVSYIDDNIVKIVIKKRYIVSGVETLHSIAAEFCLTQGNDA